MDATQRPILFPPEFEYYAEEHNIFSLFEAYLERLVIARPKDPLRFLEETISSPITQVHRIIVFGPPVPERTFICKKLCEMLGTVHVSNTIMKEMPKEVRGKGGGVKIKKVQVRFENRFKDREKRHVGRDAAPYGKADQLQQLSEEKPKESNEFYTTEEYKHHVEEDEVEDQHEILEIPSELHQNSDSASEQVNQVETDEQNDGDDEVRQLEQYSEEFKTRTIEEAAAEHLTLSGEEGDIEDLDDDDDFWQYAWQREVVVEEEAEQLIESEREPSLFTELEEEETPPPVDDEDEDVSVLFRERTPFVMRLMKLLNSQECSTKGWVMEGLPKTRLQALSLQQWAVFPTHVIFLELGKTPSSIEIEEMDNYRNKDEWIVYNEQISGIEDCYSRYYSQKFSIDKPLDLILVNILSFAETKESSNAPFRPRVLLLGLPGCGKSTQAQMLAQKYNIVNIDFSELVKHVLSLDSRWDSEDQSLVDNLAAEAVSQRIHRKDALIGGYILHGFPNTRKQADILNKKMKYRMPNRVIVMEVSKQLAYERLVFRRIDPYQRKFYHLLTDPPKEEGLFLFQRPHDEHSVVTSRIDFYLGNITELLTFFHGRVTRINGEMSISDVSEALLNAIVHSSTNHDYVVSEPEDNSDNDEHL